VCKTDLQKEATMSRWLLMLLAVAMAALLMGFARGADVAPGAGRTTVCFALGLVMMGYLVRGNRPG
jgi:hydrogenase/urease accessory protein HupE